MLLSEINITPAKEKQFNKKGIHTVEDLIRFFPRKYNDLSTETGLLPDDAISCVVVRIDDVKLYNNTKIPLIIASGRKKVTNEKIKVMWFRKQFMYRNLYKTIDNDVYVCGKAVYNEEYHNYTINEPLLFTTRIKEGKKIYPVYSKIQNMSDEYLGERIKEATEEHGDIIKEYIPEKILESEFLMPIQDAISEKHNPTSMYNLEMADYRFLFEDLLYFAGRMEQNKRLVPNGNSHGIRSMKLFNDVKAALPYTLSEGQERVINSILSDVKDGKNVQALLSSDVGSGKTTVALLVSCALACNTSSLPGYQVVWLVPSKTLAAQHVAELKGYLEPLGYEVMYFGASMKKKERDEALEKIKSGNVKFIVGTHAVLNDDVIFKDIGLIVCDEQHKLGVLQRGKLMEKCNRSAHFLSMSGTPIPRTLSLALSNNNIQLYTMERPAGRLPIKTCVTNNRASIFKFIKNEVANEHQAYVVCPMINKMDGENNIMDGVMSVEEISEIYHEEFDSLGIGVATLTGKNKAEESEEIIEKFKNNETKILIATSVIEVGINIPNATVMVIENAERFGISSLHQLRGRVGRKADSQGYCILRSEENDNERLAALVKTNDGFELSEIDLLLRKSGDLIGEDQSGENKYVELMLQNQGLYNYIKDIASELVDSGEIDELIDNRTESE